jgi:murein L,D-transpeptidase YafK
MIRYFLYFLIVFLSGIVIYYFFPERKLPKGQTIDSIVVYKSKEEMHVYADGKLLKKYSISIGKSPRGDKEYEGDNKTPEGLYIINDKNPNSSFYKNLGISYPDSRHKANARKIGKPAGGDIKIHGMSKDFSWIGKFHRFSNWTNGCIAVTNEEMEELYNAVRIGASINIKL